ncbi:MAG: peptidoglycan-binding domain-containing protein [Cyanobacteria bacterium P01_E01_bin.42]
MLTVGSQGAEVIALQEFINQQSYTPDVIGVDGIFGPGTQAAVQNFQAATGLVADGIVGPNTYAMMSSCGFVYEGC